MPLLWWGLFCCSMNELIGMLDELCYADYCRGLMVVYWNL